MTEPRDDESRSHEIAAHIGWLKMYLESMNERNWRDMQLYAQRQLERFEACIDATLPAKD